MAPQARRHYKRSWNTTPGEPAKRGRKNQRNGARAERAFERENPTAKRTGPASDYILRGRHVEVKYGTSGLLDNQKRKGGKVVRYYDKGGRLVKISDAEARQIKNRQSARRRSKGRR